MFKNYKKRLISLALAFLFLFTLLPNLFTVFAGDTLPYLGDAAKGKNQPYQHGYRAEDLLSWSPETDPYAELLKASVPLQNRNAAFAATQADPNLNPDAEFFTLTGDYGNAFFDSYPYTNEFSQHVFNFWQYTDYYASWHGMPTEEVPERLYNAEGERNGSSDWQKRYFEFGMMNLPNPGYTNAAHKNGVLSLGCIFQPRAYQHYNILLKQDVNGNFPYAEKLIEICKYYGFDGWFFNMEGRSINSENGELLGKFFNQMREAGLYIQWYTASSAFSDSTAKFLTSAKSGETQKAGDRAQSVFLDYGWSTSSLKNSVSTANKYGLKGLEAIFGGIEAGRDRWGNNFDRFIDNGKMVGSIASLGTDFMQTGLDEDLGGGGMRREQDNYQWMAFERERLWWTGGNARTSGLNAGLSGDDVGTTRTTFKGIANYITERSVVNGDTFVTNFNTGHGLEYVLNGQVSNQNEWSNIIIQDILPTWQWWFTANNSKLSAEFDYGTKYQKTLKNKTNASFDFDLVGAYNGGSSLAIFGDVDTEDYMHLYKTDLDVKAGTSVDVTFKKTSNDSVAMKLGVIFEDAPETVAELTIENTSAKSSQWVTSKVDLSAYADKKIAAIGFAFDGTASDYQINIGEIKYTSAPKQKPEAPANVAFKKVYDTGEIVVAWDIESYEAVKQYNVYKIEGSKETFLGGTYDDIFYIKDIFGTDGEVNIEVRAVSADGTESDGSAVSYDYSKAVKDITVVAEDGKLTVTWDGGEADVVVTTSYEAAARTWNASGSGQATVTVPTGKDADGARYTMTITKNGVTKTYDGRLDDSYSAPYNEGLVNFKLQNPLSKDWWKLHYDYTTSTGDSKSGSYTRGTGSGTTNDWADFSAFPSSIETLRIVLEDYSGNKSVATNYFFKDGQIIDLEKEITSEEFPDPVLRTIVKLQIGKTLADVVNYSGDFDISGTEVSDLTGLSLMNSIGTLNISGTNVSSLSPVYAIKDIETLIASNTKITEINQNMLAKTLVNVDLSNNAQLTRIAKDVVAGLTALEKLNLSGNTALNELYLNKIKTIDLDISGSNNIEKLYLTGTEMTTFDISSLKKLSRFYANNSALESLTLAEPSEYTNIYCFNLSASKFDLSSSTPEGKLVEALEDFIELNPVTPELDEPTNIAIGSTVTTNANSSNASNMVDGNTNTHSGSIANGRIVTVNLGFVQNIEKWRIQFYYGSGYASKEFTLEASLNNENFTVVDSSSTNTAQIYAKEFDEPVNARYFRFTPITGGDWGSTYITEIELHGRPVEPFGVEYGDQKPAIHLAELPEKVVFTENSSEEIRVMDYFEKMYSDAVTVRGTKLSTLEGAAWIAADYDIAKAITPPGKVYVEITDSEGNLINDINAPEGFAVKSSDGGEDVAKKATVISGSGENYNEKYTMLFDGNTQTKWCTGGNSGWMAFYLEEAVAIEKWVTTHAEVVDEPASYNTDDFELQVLNLDAIGMTEDEVIASKLSDKTLFSNNNNWTTISHVSGNKNMIVDQEVDSDVEARIYRFKINKAINGSSNSAIRVHELELYAKELVPRDYDGYMSLAKAGTYNVQFKKGKNTLSSMTVNVVANKDALDKFIAKCEALVEDDYTPVSWASFMASFADIKAVAQNEFASQEDIDNAFFDLMDAKDKLVSVAFTDLLSIAIELAKGQDVTSCTPNSVKNLEDVIKAGEALLENKNASQSQIDDMVDNLFDAINSLVDIVDNTRLVKLIDKVENMDLGKYTKDSVDNLKDALASAKAVADDKNATEEDIENAYSVLTDAIIDLVIAKNTKGLETIIAKADSVLAKVNDYKPSSVKGLKAAANDAKAVLADESATQEKIDLSMRTLATEVAKARLKANQTAILKTVETAKSVDKSNFTAESVNTLETALTSALYIIGDTDSSQDAIDSANLVLGAAIKNLELLSGGANDTQTGQNNNEIIVLISLLTLSALVLLVAIRKRNNSN